MTLSSVLKTLSVTTVAMTAAVSTIAPAEAFVLQPSSLTITGTAVFGSPADNAPDDTTLGFRTTNVENADGDFSSLFGSSPTISTLNLTIDPTSILASDGNPNTNGYTYVASSQPFIDFGLQDLFNTGDQLLTFDINPGTIERNWTSAADIIEATFLNQVTGTFFFGNSVIGTGRLNASQSGTGAGYDITLSAEPIPEPFTILGSLSALGVGTVMKKQHDKRQNKA